MKASIAVRAKRAWDVMHGYDHKPKKVKKVHWVLAIDKRTQITV